MSSRSIPMTLFFAAGLVGAEVSAAGPELGEEIAAEDLSAWDISIAPDGAGLPAGSGSVAAGAEIYATKCARCHGDTGTEAPQILWPAAWVP